MRRRILPAALLAALLGAPARAPADEVRTKDGRVLEGKVLEDGPAGVKIRLRFGGELTLRRDEVQAVERKDLPEEAVAKKRAALAPGDAEGLWRLALEARDLKLRKAFEGLVDEILRISPDHAGANEAKGRVKYDGRWVDPKERDRLEAEKERQRKQAQGLVEHKGRWVTPEERDALDRGLVFHDGRWMSEREAKEAEGFVPHKGGWVKKEELESVLLRDSLVEAAGVPLTVAQSERFSVATVYNQADTNLVLQDAEKACAEFSRWFGVAPGERLFDHIMNRQPRRCSIVILEKEAQYQKFIEGLLRSHEELRTVTSKEMIDLWKRQSGFVSLDPDCWIVGYRGAFPKERTRHSVVHKLSHVLLQRWRNKGTRWTRYWLAEGLGEVQEINAFGSCQVFCVRTEYGERGGDDAKAIGEGWKAEAKRLAAAGGDSRFRDLGAKPLADLQPWDLVKSWSMVHYLLSLDREKFVSLVALLKAQMPLEEALAQSHGATPEQMDDRWRDFVKRTY